MKKLSKSLIKSLLLFTFLYFIIMLIVLLPRDAYYMIVGEDLNSTERELVYEFNFPQYSTKIIEKVKQLVQTGSFGPNEFGNPVIHEIKDSLLLSGTLIFSAFGLSILLGLGLGLFQAIQIYKGKSSWTHKFTWLFQAVPDFFIVITVQYFLILCIRKGFINIDIYGNDEWYNALLPIFFLSLYPLIYIARITTSALLEEKGNDYLRTALSKGTHETKIIWKHVLPNALLKIVSHSSTIMLYIVTSLPIVEYLSFYHGAAHKLLLALHIINGTGNPFFLMIDESTVLSLLFFFIIILCLASLLGHVLSYIVNPRAKGEVN